MVYLNIFSYIENYHIELEYNLSLPEDVLKALCLLDTIGNLETPESMYPIYLSKDSDDAKYGGLIIWIIILQALTFVYVSISLLLHTHMHRAISYYRTLQLHIRYAE